jgi:hypothetical protein
MTENGQTMTNWLRPARSHFQTIATTDGMKGVGVKGINDNRTTKRGSWITNCIGAGLRWLLSFPEIRDAMIDGLLPTLLEDPRVLAKIERHSGGILGCEEVRRLIALGEIGIYPLWDPVNNPADREREEPWDNETLNVRIGTKFTRPKRGINVHMTRDEIADVLAQGDQVEVPIGTEIVVQPGEGIIYEIFERIKLSPRYCARLSTLSRGGRALWMAVPGADVLHPGQDNNPTGEGLNLNLGFEDVKGVSQAGNPLIFVAGVTEVAQVTFHRVIGGTNGRIGRYSRQKHHNGGVLTEASENGRPK